MTKNKKSNDTSSRTSWLPDREVKALARCFLPAIKQFYETEEGRNAFAEWERGEAKKVRRTEEHREAGAAGKDGCDDGKD
jgi:hypothetical protein